MDIQKNVSLKSFNTFGIDVSANTFCSFKGVDDLRSISDQQIPLESTIILGGGSNILFTDDYPGLVARNEISGIEVMDQSSEYVWIKVGAGVIWQEIVEFCVKNDFGGIENLSLIPGTTGAAPMQNIGAYGVELKEVFVELEAYNRNSAQIEIFKNEDCNFGYRESIFKTSAKNKYIITSVTLRLTRKDHQINTGYGAISHILEDWDIESPSIRDVSNVVMSIRRSKLPDPKKIGNAGSFFKNPIIDKIDYEALKLEFPGVQVYDAGPDHVKVPAGWLIDQCGWKGKRIGNIGVHKNQALVLVNYGGGKGSDLVTLAKDIQTSVSDTYGIELQPEVNII
jgi:UDP-N-acetylmuramate dehydrogenase